MGHEPDQTGLLDTVRSSGIQPLTTSQFDQIGQFLMFLVTYFRAKVDRIFGDVKTIAGITANNADTLRCTTNFEVRIHIPLITPSLFTSDDFSSSV